MDRERKRLFLGLGAAAVGAAVVYAVFHWSLPPWLALIGLVIFIVCSNYPELIIPRTPQEQEAHDQKILAEGENLKRTGAWRYALALAIPVVLAFTATLYFRLRPHWQTLHGREWPTIVVISVALFLLVLAVGASTFWWHSRRARRVAQRRSNDV